MTRVDPSSPVYQEVARLHRAAQELRPGGIDRWNGELYSRTDDKWGGLGRDGTMRLHQDRVLRHLTGGRASDDPVMQAQALATVLHESTHARSEFDAKHEPNALRQQQSVGLDEGLTEAATIEDFETFSRLAGYQDVPQPTPEYAGAVHATNELLDRASSSEADRRELVTAALNSPVMMRWDVIADRVVQNELGDAVPPDPAHQQAARAHLVNQMAVPQWNGVQDREDAGAVVAADTNNALDSAVGDLRTHYASGSNEPFPAKTPNPAAETARNTEQARAIGAPGQGEAVDLSKLPPPDAATRVDSPRQPAHTGEMRFLSGQAPAARATRHAPSLGDGARGAGAPQVAGVGRRSPGERGRE